MIKTRFWAGTAQLIGRFLTAVLLTGAGLLLAALPAGAEDRGQDSRAVIAVLPFEGDTASPEALRLLENQAMGAVLQTGDYRVISQEKRQEILQEIAFSQSELGSRQGRLNLGRQLAAQGLISGRIGKTDNHVYASLNLIKTVTGEVIRSKTARFPAMDDMIEGMPSVVLQLFGYQEESPAERERPGSTDAAARIAGRWRGDKGIETAVLNRDGSGRAVMTGGAVMKLRYQYRDNQFIVTQDQPNRIDFYTGLVPMDVASRLKKEARPMEWVFSLSANGQRLEGIKYTTSFTKERGIITEIDNSYHRSALWRRLE